MTASEDAGALVDREVRGKGDVRIGRIGEIWVDPETGTPLWAGVETGLFGISQSLVPLTGADLSGADVAVPYDRARVEHAPRVDPEADLSPDDEAELDAYYGLPSGDVASGAERLPAGRARLLRWVNEAPADDAAPDEATRAQH